MSQLFEQLRKRKDDRGMMANLRCVLVKNKRHRAWPSLHRLGVAIDELSALPFIAGLYATHPEETGKCNFGKTCKVIQSKRDGSHGEDGKLTPTERRFQHLLVADRNELPGRVLRMVLMAKAQGVPVNYEQLATDIRYWDDGVKNKWASAFWAQENEEPEGDE